MSPRRRRYKAASTRQATPTDPGGIRVAIGQAAGINHTLVVGMADTLRLERSAHKSMQVRILSRVLKVKTEMSASAAIVRKVRKRSVKPWSLTC